MEVKRRSPVLSIHFSEKYASTGLPIRPHRVGLRFRCVPISFQHVTMPPKEVTAGDLLTRSEGYYQPGLYPVLQQEVQGRRVSVVRRPDLIGALPAAMSLDYG